MFRHLCVRIVSQLQIPRRFVSSSAAIKRPPQLASVLRKLYIRSHPDLLSRFPEAQRQNETALKTLNHFMDDWNTPNALTERMYPVTIFLLPDQTKGVSPAEDSPGELQRVSVILRPPLARATEVQKRRHVSSMLSEFFERCGIEYDGGDLGQGTRVSETAIASLQGFIKDNAHLNNVVKMGVRKNMSRSLELATTMYRLQYGAGLLWESNMPLREQVQAMKALRVALEATVPASGSLTVSDYTQRDVFEEDLDPLSKAAARVRAPSLHTLPPLHGCLIVIRNSALEVSLPDELRTDEPEEPGTVTTETVKRDTVWKPGAASRFSLEDVVSEMEREKPRTGFADVLAGESSHTEASNKPKVKRKHLGGEIRPNGSIVLDAAFPEAWVSFLETVNFDECRQLRERTKAMNELELTLAEHMGIGAIMPDDSIASTQAYSDYLQRLRTAVEEGSLSATTDYGDMSGITLHVIPPSSAENSSAAQPYTVHESMGLMHIPVLATAVETAAFLQSHSHIANDRLKEYLRVSKEEKDVILQVKRMYQLQELTRDDAAITSESMIDCCQRLIEHHGRLQKTIQGLSLHVSNKFHVDPTDGTITIKWDWL